MASRFSMLGVAGRRWFSSSGSGIRSNGGKASPPERPNFFAPLEYVQQHANFFAVMGVTALVVFSAGGYFWSLKQDLKKEREIREKDVEKERALREKDVEKERAFREKDMEKERELRELERVNASANTARQLLDLLIHADYDKLQQAMAAAKSLNVNGQKEPAKPLAGKGSE